MLHMSCFIEFLQEVPLDEHTHITAQHEFYRKSLSTQFTGRQKLLKQCIQYVRDDGCSLVVLSGKPGTGKSALMVGVNFFNCSLKKERRKLSC